MSEAYAAGDDFGADFEVDYDELGDLGDVFTVTDDEGNKYTVGDPEALRQVEREQLAAEVMNHELEQARAEVAESFPDLPPGLVKMLQADSPEELHDLAANVAARLGVQSVERHPGAKADPVASMEGDSLSRAMQWAKQTGDHGPLFRLKEAEAFARAGLTGSMLNDYQREAVRQALAWARRSGDQASIAYLSRQLGGGR